MEVTDTWPDVEEDKAVNQNIVPPKWFVCSVEEFERKWLVGWESGTITRPTEEDLDRCDRWWDS